MFRISVSLIVIVLLAVAIVVILPALGPSPETFEVDEEGSDAH